MQHRLYLEFEHYRDGKLLMHREEEAHSWTHIGWSKMLRFFLLMGVVDIKGFSAGKDDIDKGILIGGSDKEFDFYDSILDDQHVIEATETDQYDYMLEYLDTEVQPIEYDSAAKKWTAKIKRGFSVISSHLGGENVVVKEIGLAERDKLVWARDVLGEPITIEPLDTLHITYKIHTDMSDIDTE